MDEKCASLSNDDQLLKHAPVMKVILCLSSVFCVNCWTQYLVQVNPVCCDTEQYSIIKKRLEFLRCIHKSISHSSVEVFNLGIFQVKVGLLA
jgi:hypothetical protein